MLEIFCNAIASSNCSNSLSSVISFLIIPKKTSTKRRASSTDLPLIISIIIDAEAWLIAQPEPVYAASFTMPSTTLSCNVRSSPQLGL